MVGGFAQPKNSSRSNSTHDKHVRDMIEENATRGPQETLRASAIKPIDADQSSNQ